MEIEEFKLERIQSLYENTVELNLSDSGVHPMSLNDLLSGAEMRELQALELGYGWTNGAVSLRERIAALYEGRTADEIIVTNGSAEANFLLVMSLLNPGDEIIVFTPNYLQIWGWARALGVKAKAVGHDGDAGWQPKLAELEAAISANTRLITICHPNNPTGAVMPPEGMRELVRIAAAHDVYLHADEVYKGLELHGPEGGSFLDIYDKAIVTNGVSKALALPGLRIGWLAGPAKDVQYGLEKQGLHVHHDIGDQRVCRRARAETAAALLDSQAKQDDSAAEPGNAAGLDRRACRAGFARSAAGRRHGVRALSLRGEFHRTGAPAARRAGRAAAPGRRVRTRRLCPHRHRLTARSS